MDPQHLLRMALRANATLSTLSGVIFVIPARTLPALTGLPSSELISLGAGLLLFAGLLWWISTRSFSHRWVQAVVLLVVILDVLWVVGVVVQLITSPMFTVAGRWIFATLALLVATLAEVQGYALWRVHRQSKSSPASERTAS
jgi:hypothetical protein